MIVLRYLNYMNINIVLYVNVKEDVHTRLTYNYAHLRLNNKKTKNKLSQKDPRDWALILDKKWFDQFFTISDHFWKKIIFDQKNV